MTISGQLVDASGRPLRANGSAHALADLLLQHSRRANLSYDAARDSDEFRNYWAHADRLDADAANSPAVRSKLVSRSRYEAGSNAYYDGALQTLANYTLGRSGPQLRMQATAAGFNQAVETTFASWARVVHLRRKLWCLAAARPQDGEGIALAITNPRLRHRVSLDLQLIETEQCATPNLPWAAPGRVDGVHFDVFGNPTAYDILPQHPGGQQYVQPQRAQTVPARFVLHWYQLRRPGQHRGIPEFRSSLNTGASARRFREATVSAAEAAANISVLLHTSFQPDEVEQLIPFTQVEFVRRALLALPQGWSSDQIDAKHPNATYAEFSKQLLTETGRPKSLPFNLTACDSSTSNFASAKIDREAFYAAIDTDREDANDCVLDPLFALWWAEAVREYGWSADPDEPPPHIWTWPRYPVVDVVAEAQANETKLRTGQTTLSRVWQEAGHDFEDELPTMASDFGVSVDEMRQILRTAIFNAQGQQAAAAPAADDDEETPADAA